MVPQARKARAEGQYDPSETRAQALAHFQEAHREALTRLLQRAAAAEAARSEAEAGLAEAMALTEKLAARERWAAERVARVEAELFGARGELAEVMGGAVTGVQVTEMAREPASMARLEGPTVVRLGLGAVE